MDEECIVFVMMVEFDTVEHACKGIFWTERNNPIIDRPLVACEMDKVF